MMHLDLLSSRRARSVEELRPERVWLCVYNAQQVKLAKIVVDDSQLDKLHCIANVSLHWLRQKFK